MRLNQKTIAALIKVFSKYINNHSAELRLFGSRVDDSLKGGDIDLLLIVENKFFLEQLIDKKHYLLSSIKAEIGDQKIDLKITMPEKLTSEPFYQQIYATSELIHRF